MPELIKILIIVLLLLIVLYFINKGFVVRKRESALRQAKYYDAFIKKIRVYGVGLHVEGLDLGKLDELKEHLEKKHYSKVLSITNGQLKILLPIISKAMIKGIIAEETGNEEMMVEVIRQVNKDLGNLAKKGSHHDDALKKIAEVEDKARQMLGVEEEKPDKDKKIRELLKKDEMMDEVMSDD